MNKIHIAAITDQGVCDIFTASTERKLLDKLEKYLSNEVKFNTLKEFEDYLYDNDVYDGCEVFFEVQEIE
jgi:hypothetical protein